MYYLQSSENIVLRPEGTSGVYRALAHASGDQRVYYCGPFFRHENNQKGRYRQFHQFGVECFSKDSFKADIEILCIASQILNKLKIPYKLELNFLGSADERMAYQQELNKYFKSNYDSLSETSKKKYENGRSFRILDSKENVDKNLLIKCPHLTNYLSKNSLDKFNRITSTLNTLGIQYVHNPFIIRGVDFYSDLCFEFTSDSSLLGASQNALIGGGRYDKLGVFLGSVEKPAIGFGAGIERIIEVIPEIQVRNPIIVLNPVVNS